jgi:hypothetical protein
LRQENEAGNFAVKSVTSKKANKQKKKKKKSRTVFVFQETNCNLSSRQSIFVMSVFSGQ